MPFGKIDAGEILQVVDDLLDAHNSLARLVDQAADVIAQIVEIGLFLRPADGFQQRRLRRKRRFRLFVGCDDGQQALDLFLERSKI